METVHFCIFSLFWEIQIDQNIKGFQKAEFIFFNATVQLYSKQNLVLHVKVTFQSLLREDEDYKH